ncbi:hypothetical protein SFRURICE_013197 [Spodoptera frugiperda]|uniref:Retinol dehydrogenase 11 n=1 Tax=Spodoptera frugiperda TaxID=7108 RepID=A0A9R0CTQ8_SPOFR|nr:retinol dehydrogenase 11 [Spodoptera frugiperda]KAF9793785.1 hypothetical protein SFRURICE_013197 [Spodoptera frugiperda]
MYGILLILALVIIIALVVGIHQKNTNAVCLSRRRLEGKTIIVTGGTAGMGLEMAVDFANRGAKVIIACPFEDEGKNARNLIIQQTENQNIVFKLLNLASLKSVRQFAADILRSEDRLDVLINNAGVGAPRDKLTQDGLNFIMQVNYYGAFLLTLLLLPLLIKTGKPGERSRILLTTSVLHRIGQMDFENMNKTDYWYKIQIYGNSKLCLIPFASELSKRLEGTNVVVNNVDPGAVGTRIFDSGSKVLGFFLRNIIINLFKTPWQGAQTALYAALDKKAGEVSGAYFRNCGLARAVNRAYCEKTAKILWEESVRLVQLTNEEVEQCFKSL